MKSVDSGYPWILTVELNPGPKQMDRAAQEFQPGTMGYGALFVQPPSESENTTSTFEKLLILIQDIFKEPHKSDYYRFFVSQIKLTFQVPSVCNQFQRNGTLGTLKSSDLL